MRVSASLGPSFVAALLLLAGARLPTSSGFAAAPITRIKDTKVAVDGIATSSVAPPPALSQNVTLSNYMRLPCEQYVLIPMPLGSSLTVRSDDGEGSCTQQPHTSLHDGTEFGQLRPSLHDGTEFELVVPTITFFKLSLQPVVYASVRPQSDRVVISSNKCILRGSSFIEKTQLNDRFDFSVTTTLTWEDALHKPSATQSVNQDGDVEGLQQHECTGYSISAETSIDVDVDVPPPFSRIPKRILERTGNAAMRLSLRYIQANFVSNLAADYAKWATDSTYREYRASLTKGVGVEEEVMV